MHGDKDKDASAVTDSNELARLCCSELNGGIQIPFKEFVFCNYTGLIKHSQDAGVYWVGILDASDCILEPGNVNISTVSCTLLQQKPGQAFLASLKFSDISFECNGAGELLYIYILQPMLHEVGNKKPHLTWLIQEHQHDFLHLINGAVEEDEGKT
ncbi:uncharacterized protein LOC113327610 isoform X1 [Papaver somniferum]|uniref:uncharacterized protein LOC113327610 isoform X1 n=1 Tax=Papaver somniferum TaxID=3469 RepID=UPI000E6FF286|nr:uncharacterized protein LOC113327610 isoform X1 [Papaver somniferum]